METSNLQASVLTFRLVLIIFAQHLHKLRQILPFVLLVVCSISLPVFSQGIHSYSIEVTCVSRTYSSTQSILDFKWLRKAPTVDTQFVYRKLKQDYTWGLPYRQLLDTDSTFSDTITTGNAYEYKFEKDTGYDGYPVNGYILAGHRVPAVTSRGIVLLLADSANKVYLDTIFRTFRNDLIGDGWTIELKWFSSSTTVMQIKNHIVSRYNANPTQVKSVILFGDLAVPYSGDFDENGAYAPPDGHTRSFSPPSHEGAWPADCFYGDMLHTSWPDASVNNTYGARTANQNTPGDGKFDLTELPGFLQLQVGRIDLSDMPAFSLSERELLKQYLNKNHNFRHKLVSIRERCLVDDNFGILNYGYPFPSEHFASNAYRNMAPLVSSGTTFNLDYLTTLDTSDYLWSFGFGGGSYTNCSGIGTTANLASSSQEVRSVFSGFLGSYFADFDNTNNFLRAPLAAKGNVLNTFWVGRPHWFFHQMGLGETIGFSTLRSQNNFDSTNIFGLTYPTTAYYYDLIHLSLMGDPTMRMQFFEPAHNLVAKQDSCYSRFRIKWNQSSDTAVHNYYIFRAEHIDSAFSLLGTTTSLQWVDNNPLTGDNVYMVRAEKLQVSGSGTYFNLAQGIFDTASTNDFYVPFINAGRDTSLCSRQRLTIGTHQPANNHVLFNWTPGGFTTDTVTINVASTGNRILTATDTFTLCIVKDTVSLTAFSLPLSETISNTTNQCSDSVAWNSTLNNTSGHMYSWKFYGTTGFDTAGLSLNMPDTVEYGTLGTYLATLTVQDTVHQCFHIDSSFVNVTCVSLPVEGINLSCVDGLHSKEINFVVYDNYNYAGYYLEAFNGDKWNNLKYIVNDMSGYYHLKLDNFGEYSQVRITGQKKSGDMKILDQCIWTNHANEISIYPNPVNTELYINHSGLYGNRQVKISVYSALGSAVLHGELSLGRDFTVINTLGLTPGVYMLFLESGGKSWSFRFTKS